MKNRFNNNYKKEKQQREMQKKLKAFNIFCACILGIAFMMYFFDFFNLDLDGEIQNRISGFRLSFILSGDSLKDSDNILSLINKKYHDKIAFASVSSCITLFSLLGLIGLFVYRTAKKEPLFSRVVMLFISVAFVALTIQTIACTSLAAFVEEYYYASCVTCNARSLSHLAMIVFIAFVFIYFGLSYWVYKKYGVSFQNPNKACVQKNTEKQASIRSDPKKTPKKH